MTTDTAVTVAIISAAASVLTVIISVLFSRRLQRAQAANQEGDAVKSLSEAAQIQVKTYTDSVVTPLANSVDKLQKENESLRDVMVKNQKRYDEDIAKVKSGYMIQIEQMQVQIKELSRTVESQRVSVETQREQIAILIEQSGRKDRIINDMQAEIIRLSSMVEELQRDKEHLQEEIIALQKENMALLAIRAEGKKDV